MSDIKAALKSKYPDLIPDRFGFECGDGWLQILDDFFSVVDRELPKSEPLLLLQIKEKLGGLRIYYRIGDDLDESIRRKIDDAYDRAAARSYRTCEICGKRGRFSDRRGYLTVVCEEHRNDAVPVEPESDYFRRTKDGYFRYDYEANVFVPCDPPEE